MESNTEVTIRFEIHTALSERLWDELPEAADQITGTHDELLIADDADAQRLMLTLMYC